MSKIDEGKKKYNDYTTTEEFRKKQEEYAQYKDQEKLLTEDRKVGRTGEKTLVIEEKLAKLLTKWNGAKSEELVSLMREQQRWNNLVEERHACAKRDIVAVVMAEDWSVGYMGSNNRRIDSEKCQKASIPWDGTMKNREVCKNVCGREECAETEALKTAEQDGMNLEGAVVFLTWHTMPCQRCQIVMNECWISLIVSLDDKNNDWYKVLKKPV